MSPRSLGLPDDLVRRLPSPCLLVDVEACQRNIDRAAGSLVGRPARLRPHFKAHKTTRLLDRQMRAGGCAGVTCATAAEVEVVAAAGHRDILLANQVTDELGLEALARAAASSRVTVAIDDSRHVEALSATAVRHAVTFEVLIELDVGTHRCGIDPQDARLLTLAEAVATAPGVTLRGLQGYEGHAVLLPDRAARATEVGRAAEILAAERDRLRAAGHRCDVISGGGTGTFDLASETGVLNEIQAGSYALMDAAYDRLDLPFEPALYLLATIISHTAADRAVVDCGLKATSAEYGLPRPLDPGLEPTRLSDEHLALSVADGVDVRVGERVAMIPAHVDPTINLHDSLLAFDRGSGTIEVWPVDGRRDNASAWLAHA